MSAVNPPEGFPPSLEANASRFESSTRPLASGPWQAVPSSSSAFSRRPRRLSPIVTRILVLIIIVAVLELIGQLRLVSRSTFVAPSAMLSMLATLAVNGALWPHLGRTSLECVAAFALACVAGIPLGIVTWRWPFLGRVSEPYLTALYALPLVFFYPPLLAIFGLGPTPIIVIATTMAVVPIIINTRIGFAEVREIYARLGRSVGCTAWQLYRQILFPAATPLIFNGLKIGFIYALIGSIAMEFVLADRGLGFAVRYHYNNFETPEMYAYVLLNLALAITATIVLLRGEDAAGWRAG